jgi:hypothetical protein
VRFLETIETSWNLEIDLLERGKRRRWHQRTHNIVVNTGRQFLAENITPSSLGPSSFVRTQNTVVRYVGFGIGGSRQNASDALAPPYSSAYPAGYGGTNVQTDVDVTVGRLERPVKATTGPDLWMREISTPGTFPTAQSTRFIAVFGQTDINFGAFTSVPLSEIGLYKSSADSSLPNGGAAAYPGPTGHLIAYDTFDTIHKTGVFSIEVRWEWRF